MIKFEEQKNVCIEDLKGIYHIWFSTKMDFDFLWEESKKRNTLKVFYHALVNAFTETKHLFLNRL